MHDNRTTLLEIFTFIIIIYPKLLNSYGEQRSI